MDTFGVLAIETYANSTEDVTDQYECSEILAEASSLAKLLLELKSHAQVISRPLHSYILNSITVVHNTFSISMQIRRPGNFESNASYELVRP